MLPATPRRHSLTWSVLGAGALLLFLTRPQVGPSLAPDEMQSASCLNNLSQIARAYALYGRDFDGKIPVAVDPEDRFNPGVWNEIEDAPYQRFVQTAPFLHVVLRPYVASPAVFRCPADRGWKISRLSQRHLTGAPRGLTDVRPSSFAKYGTSYYSWTRYGFDLQTAADIPDPARRVLLFDGDLWHHSARRALAGALFIDGHAELVSPAQHDTFAPAPSF